jgi:hypothetical protein
MGFSDSFASCMSPLPTPAQLLDSAGEALEFLHRLHQAWEAAGGDEEMTMGALVALGAVTGIDEATLAVLGEAATVTVMAYIAACVGCLVAAAGSSVWDLISSNDVAGWAKDQLVAEAQKQSIPNPSAVA